MKRMRFLALATIGVLLLSTTHAFAMNTKVKKAKAKHIAARNNSNAPSRPKTQFSGKVVLDSAENPPDLPEAKKECFQNRKLNIMKVTADPEDGDKKLGSATTNDEGKFSKRLAHVHGTFYFVLPYKETSDPEWPCFEETTPQFTHNH